VTQITLTTEQAAIIEYALAQYEEVCLDIVDEGHCDAPEFAVRCVEANKLRHVLVQTFGLDVDL
jgi:hypothetical protein